MHLLQSYPCGITWGSRHRWGAFSRTWNLPSHRLSSIYRTGSCGVPTCPLPTTPPPPPSTTSLPPNTSQPPTISQLQTSHSSNSSPSGPSSPSSLIAIVQSPLPIPDVGSGQSIGASGQVELENLWKHFIISVELSSSSWLWPSCNSCSHVILYLLQHTILRYDTLLKPYCNSHAIVFRINIIWV